MIDFADLVLHRYDLLVVLVLHDQHRDGACSELIHQDVLTLDCLNAVRQIGQNIVIDPRMCVTPHCRNQQYKGEDQDQMPCFYHCVAKTLHSVYSLLTFHYLLPPLGAENRQISYLCHEKEYKKKRLNM